MTARLKHFGWGREGEGLSLSLMAAGGVTFLVVVVLITRRVRASMRDLEARRVAG